MDFRIVKYDDADAADVGAYAFLSMREALTLQGVPLPRIQDSDVFTALWTQGALQVAVFEIDRRPIACRVMLLVNHMLSSEVMVLRGVSLFVEPAERGKNLGKRLIDESNAYMIGEHNVWQIEELAHSQEIQTLLVGSGYKPAALYLSKEVVEWHGAQQLAG